MVAMESVVVYSSVDSPPFAKLQLTADALAASPNADTCTYMYTSLVGERTWKGSLRQVGNSKTTTLPDVDVHVYALPLVSS